jgi:hypothetical protein
MHKQASRSGPSLEDHVQKKPPAEADGFEDKYEDYFQRKMNGVNTI